MTLKIHSHIKQSPKKWNIVTKYSTIRKYNIKVLIILGSLNLYDVYLNIKNTDSIHLHFIQGQTLQVMKLTPPIYYCTFWIIRNLYPCGSQYFFYFFFSLSQKIDITVFLANYGSHGGCIWFNNDTSCINNF